MTIEIQGLKADLLLSMLKLMYFLPCHSYLFPVFMSSKASPPSFSTYLFPPQTPSNPTLAFFRCLSLI